MLSYRSPIGSYKKKYQNCIYEIFHHFLSWQIDTDICKYLWYFCILITKYMKDELKLFCFCLESLISRRYIEYKKSMVFIYILQQYDMIALAESVHTILNK